VPTAVANPSNVSLRHQFLSSSEFWTGSELARTWEAGSLPGCYHEIAKESVAVCCLQASAKTSRRGVRPKSFLNGGGSGG